MSADDPPVFGRRQAAEEGPLKSRLVALIALAALAMLLCLMVGGEVAQRLFGAVAMVFPVLLIALGAMRDGRLPGAGALVVLTLLLEGGYWVMVLLRGRVEDGPWLFGLPLAATALLFLIWLLPLALVSWTYARHFEEHGVREGDLERLRRATEREDTP